MYVRVRTTQAKSSLATRTQETERHSEIVACIQWGQKDRTQEKLLSEVDFKG